MKGYRYILKLWIVAMGIGLMSLTEPVAEQSMRVVRWDRNDTLRIYFAPYEFSDSRGNPKGFNVDIIQSLMKEANIPYIIVLKDWNTVMRAYTQGKADVVMGMSYSDERAKKFKFGMSYASLYQGAVSVRGKGTFKTIESLKGKRVLVDKGDLLEDKMRQAGLDKEIITISNNRDGLKAVSQGKADVLLCSVNVARYWIKEDGLTNLDIYDLKEYPKDYGYAAHNAQLLAEMDHALMKMKENGTYEKIHDQWFSEDMTTYVMRIIYSALAVLVVCGAVFFLFVFMLRHRVNMAKRVILEQNHSIRLAVMAGNLSVWGYDVATDMVYNVERSFFSDKGEPLASVLKIFHSDDGKLFAETITRLLRGEEPPQKLCFRMQADEDGNWRYFEQEFTQICDKSGKIVKIIGTHHEVTDVYRMQMRLRESLRKMEYAVTSSDMVLWELNSLTMECRSYNEPLTNYDECLDVPLTNLEKHVHPDDLPIVHQVMERLAQGIVETKTFDLRVWYDIDKAWHYCSITATPFAIDESTGKVTRYVGFRRDNTKVIQFNEERRKFSEEMNYVLKESGIHVWKYDLESKELIVMSAVNSVIERISSEEYFNRVDSSQRDAVRTLFAKMDSGEVKSFSNQLKVLTPGHKTPRYIIFNGIPTTDAEGKVVSYFGLRRDVTDLIEIQLRLEKEKQKAQMADKLKSAFLANISHEIRTPLNSIVGFSSLLQETPDEEEKQQYMNIINTNSELLLRLINDILDLSKIESGVIELREDKIDMALNFEMLGATLRERCQSPDIEFIVENPYSHCEVICDSKSITQIITNFTVNAIKYTQRGYVKMGYSYDGKGLKLYVEDTGIGIAEANKRRLFRRFDKFDDFAQGTGLGLAICKAITDAYKGKVGCNSCEGKGSTFWAWIPCRHGEVVER